jgi:hypothetical protein
LSEEPAEQLLAHASASGELLTRCTKTSESVYGFDRNGCTEWLGIRTSDARESDAISQDEQAGSEESC